MTISRCAGGRHQHRRPLAEAKEQGIAEREIAEAVGGNLLAAMRKAIAAKAKE